MGNKMYHHGDLRRALIETGIEVISREGEDKLSLRKAAEKCGVSSAAPYAHFKSKSELIAAMQQHVMKQFTDVLEEAVSQTNGNSPADDTLLTRLGKAYVMFFYQNPLYFDFLFSRKNICKNLSMKNSNETENPPLAVLQKTALLAFQKENLSEKEIQNRIIAMWALVHGLSAIVTMPDIRFDDDWETRIEEIITSLRGIPQREKEEQQ